jgi:hypothetical protein
MALPEGFSISWSQDLADGVYSDKDVIVISKDIEFYLNLNTNSALARGLQLSEQEVGILKSAAKLKLSGSSTEVSSTFELNFPLIGSTGEPRAFRKIVLSLLPSGGSRHNTASRPHAVTNLVKCEPVWIFLTFSFFILSPLAHKGSAASPVVYLYSSARDWVMAQCAAVARAFPTLSMKTGVSTLPSSFHVVVELSSVEGVERMLLLSPQMNNEY